MGRYGAYAPHTVEYQIYSYEGRLFAFGALYISTFQGRFRASRGDFVTCTYNSVTDAKDHLWGPLRFVFTTTIVCSNGRQVVVVIDFFTFKKPLTQCRFSHVFRPQ